MLTTVAKVKVQLEEAEVAREEAERKVRASDAPPMLRVGQLKLVFVLLLFFLVDYKNLYFNIHVMLFL